MSDVIIAPIATVTDEEYEAMKSLYSEYYAGAPSTAFAKDFREKDWVILLFDSEKVVGFSTQKIVHGENGTVFLFSGDTIVDVHARRQVGLASAFRHLVESLYSQYDEAQLYWFLISKGARTYRFLTTFFNEFYPKNGDERNDRLEVLTQSIAMQLYPDSFNPSAGVLHFEADKDFLISDFMRDDEASAYFRKMNPNWARGDELCCLTSLKRSNFNSKADWVYQAVTPKWRSV